MILVWILGTIFLPLQKIIPPLSIGYNNSLYGFVDCISVKKNIITINILL